MTPYRPQPRRPISRPLPWQRVPAGFVARRGIGLVLDGQPFTFTGMNIYNANSTGDCWHSMAGGQGLKRALRDIGGGQEVFRAWFFQSLATDRGKRDWRAFDRTLRLAKARGQKVIVVFADQWSACERPSRRWASFYASGYRKQVDPGTTRTYRRYVAEVVKRYRDDPTVLMWQLVNEAETARRNGTCAPASVLRDFAADMSSLIKQIDTHHLVSLGTIGGQQCGMRGSGYRAIHAVPGIDVCEVHDYSAPSVGLPRIAATGSLAGSMNARASASPSSSAKSASPHPVAASAGELRGSVVSSRHSSRPGYPASFSGAGGTDHMAGRPGATSTSAPEIRPSSSSRDTERSLAGVDRNENRPGIDGS